MPATTRQISLRAHPRQHARRRNVPGARVTAVWITIATEEPHADEQTHHGWHALEILQALGYTHLDDLPDIGLAIDQKIAA